MTTAADFADALAPVLSKTDAELRQLARLPETRQRLAALVARIEPDLKSLQVLAEARDRIAKALDATAGQVLA